MMMTENPDVAAALTQAIPFNNHVGLHINTARDGEATGELAVRPDLHNHIGTLHAAAQYALIEALSGAATASVLLADIARVTPLVEAIEVRYLKLLKGDAHGRATMTTNLDGIQQALEKDGRARFDVHVVLTGSDGVEATDAVAHWYVRINR
jgi:acyl-coenzyme A thioesterase PaaI-like protein